MNRLLNRCKIGFVYNFEYVDRYGRVKWRERLTNLIPTAGLTYLINAAMTGGSQYDTWYIGLSGTSYAPIAGETMTTLLTNAPEFTNYSNAARVTLVPDVVSAGLYANTDSPAEFTFTGTGSIALGFLSSNSVKLSTSGLLISAVQFPSPRVIEEIGDKLRVVAGIELTAA